MKLSRRNFFRAAAATPIAMRQAAGEAATAGLGGFMGVPAGSGVPASMASGGADPYTQTHNHLVNMVRSRKIPDWQMIRFRQEARTRARFLDADILNMRSISDAARYRLQEDREVERVVSEYLDNNDSEKGWSALYKGFCDRVWPT